MARVDGDPEQPGGVGPRRRRGCDGPDPAPAGAEAIPSRGSRPTAPSVPGTHGVESASGELVAQLGHELKTPLSILLALCNRLEEGGRLEGQDARDLERIRHNAFAMLRRVQDLLLVSRMQSADIPLDIAVIDAAAVVRRSLDGFESLAAARGVELVVQTPRTLHAALDDERLVSVVSNLVANALRHTPPGGIVRCTLHTVPGHVVLEVADSGPGIAPERRREVFERHQRGATSTGSGLGLAIVAEIAALHDGETRVGDAPEGGALFTFSAPRRLGDARTARAVAPLTIDERQRAIVEELRGALGAGPPLPR